MSDGSPLSELMASNDPMATPLMSVGPPPAMPTGPATDPHIGQPIAPMMQPPVGDSPPSQKRSKQSGAGGDLRDAFIVALVCFISLMPTVQRILASQLSMMEDKTSAAVVTSCIAGIGFYVLKEYMSK